jgi:hypothetical protein
VFGQAAQEGVGLHGVLGVENDGSPSHINATSKRQQSVLIARGLRPPQGFNKATEPLTAEVGMAPTTRRRAVAGGEKPTN